MSDTTQAIGPRHLMKWGRTLGVFSAWFYVERQGLVVVVDVQFGGVRRPFIIGTIAWRQVESARRAQGDAA